jgi:CubicO group peptidase (beta-lactamase class C family)
MRLAHMICTALGALSFALPALAQTGQAPVAPPNPLAPSQARTAVASPLVPVAATSPQLTRADLEGWLDGYMPYALQRGDVAGAVVVVVKDGQILLQKGYGYSDVAKRTPVDPETTLFRPGSVSKLFTWTAVMQQVEQGKINLDADINTYLDFKMPARDGKPITMRNLMTHTAGFEEAIKDLMGKDIKVVPALGPYLKRWTPTRIFAPGEVPAYSNYATALAGYIVTRTSGQPFDDYIEQHIFQPLGMTHASFRQPLPASLQPFMSKGYKVGSGKEEPYEYLAPAPAGSLAASGADMGRFMIAHLQNGTYNGAQILKPETAILMHTSATTIVPGVNRMMLGFYETNINGHRVIAHGGDTQVFHSYLHLFLDDNVGLYVSVNSAGKAGAAGSIRNSLFEGFADRYFPAGAPAPSEVDAKTAAEHAKLIASQRYFSSRRMESSFLSTSNMMGQTTVKVNDDGTITVAGFNGNNGAPIKWREIKPFVWQDVAGRDKLGAQVKDGKVTMFTFDQVSPFMMWMPVPAAKSTAWLNPALGVGLVALLLTALLWPVAAIVRRRYRTAFPLEGRAAKSYRLVRLASIVTLVVFGLFITTFIKAMSDFSMLSSALDGWITTLHILAIIAFVGGALVGLWNLFVVWTGQRSWFAKLWSLVLALSFLVVLWFGVVFHWVGLGTGY